MTHSLPTIVAVHDPRLSARIVSSTPLVYGDASAPELDRPPHVRAASGVVRIGGDLYIVQDDASFFAVRRADGSVSAIDLPAGPGGRRRFEVALGNKMDKLDLESCVALDGARVIGFGSGSHAVRERIAILDVASAAARVHDASELYAALRARAEFAGSELNVEGAVVLGGVLRLFQRGNGAARDGVEAVNATVDLDVSAFLRWMDGGPLPALTNVRRYDLGHERGVAYGFTDATTIDSRVLYSAGAEDSPDVIEDGEVLGARIGVLEDQDARWTALLEPDGAPSVAKIEGIVSKSDGDHRRLYAVIDPDDPERPALLCEVALDGPW